MAKKVKSQEEQRRLLLEACVRFFLTKEGYTMQELANMMMISRSALYAKLANNERFSFFEIRRLFSILQLDDETRLQLLY